MSAEMHIWMEELFCFFMDIFTSGMEEFTLWRKLHFNMDEFTQKYGYLNIKLLLLLCIDHT